MKFFSPRQEITSTHGRRGHPVEIVGSTPKDGMTRLQMRKGFYAPSEWPPDMEPVAKSENAA